MYIYATTKITTKLRLLCIDTGFILATCYMRHHEIPLLTNKMSYSPQNLKKYLPLRGGGCSTKCPKFGKISSKNPLLCPCKTFLPFLLLYVWMSLIYALKITSCVTYGAQTQTKI